MSKPKCTVRNCKRPARILGKLCSQHGMLKADTLLSAWVRGRDKTCTAEGMFDLNCKGVLQAAHIVGRKNYATRYDAANVHALCAAHHYFLDKPGREGHKWQWGRLRFPNDHHLEALYERSLRKTDRASVIGETLVSFGWEQA